MKQYKVYSSHRLLVSQQGFCVWYGIRVYSIHGYRGIRCEVKHGGAEVNVKSLVCVVVAAHRAVCVTSNVTLSVSLVHVLRVRCLTIRIIGVPEIECEINYCLGFIIIYLRS